MDYKKIFEERYSGLNERQKEAVNTIFGPVLVVAGPGTGKTEILSMRIANILRETDTLPSSILCLTFTENAAYNMRKRLASIIGADAYKVAIHTFHGFGNEIISKNPEYFYGGADFKAIDEVYKLEVLETVLKKLPHNSKLKSHHEQQGYAYLRDIQERIEDLKKAGLTPAEFKLLIEENKLFLEEASNIAGNFLKDFKFIKSNIEKFSQLINMLSEIKSERKIFLKNFKSLKETVLESINLANDEALNQKSTKPITAWKDDMLKKNFKNEYVFYDWEKIRNMEELAFLYENYVDEMQKRGLFDFADMLMHAVKTVEETPELKFNLQEKYQYLLIDEFQDTSGIQMRILDNLLENPVNEGNPNVFAVGDDDQSIFKFQGAELANILSFREKFTGLKTVVLNKNYRSGQQILDLASGIIKKGKERLENLGDFSKKLESEKKEIKAEIQSLEFSSEGRESLFVAKKIQELSKECPYSKFAIIGRKHRHLETTLAALNSLKIPFIYKKETDVLEQEHIIQLINCCKFIVNENQDVLPQILAYPFWEIDAIEIWKISLKARKEKKSWLELLLISENPKLKAVAEFFIKLQSLAKIEVMEEVLDILMGNKDLDGFNSQFKNFYFNQENKTDYIERLESLRKLIGLVRNFRDEKKVYLKDLIQFIELHERHKKGIEMKIEMDDEINAVNILTVHGAKGLEFENVFVVSCTDSGWMKGASGAKLRFPENLPISAGKDGEDDILRLFYVALSRAKKRLFLTYGLKDDVSGKLNTKLRFLEGEVDTEKVEYAENFERENLSKKISFTENETAFLNEIIKNYKLNPSHLNTFIDLENGGPKKFLENNILKFPEKLQTSNCYGTAIHETLNHALIEMKRKGSLPNTEDLLKFFEEKLSGMPLNQDEQKELLAKGSDELPQYLKSRKDTFSAKDETEMDFNDQHVTMDDIDLTGKIDRIIYNKEKNEIIVLDYKTGNPVVEGSRRTEHDNLKMLKYENQINFYKLLIENSRFFKGTWKVNKGIIDFIKPGEDGNISSQIVEIDSEQQERTKKLIKAVFKKIKNLDFPDVSKYEKNYFGTVEFIEDLIYERI